MTVVPDSARPATNSQRRARWLGSGAAPGSAGGRKGGPGALARIETRAGLVEKQNGRTGEQSDGDVDALLVAAGERGHGVVASLRQSRLAEHLLDGGLDVADPLHVGEEPQVLLDREAAVEPRLLRDPADLAVRALDPARVGLCDAGKDREQGGLAGAVRSQHREQLAGLHLEVDIAEGRALAEGLGETVHFEHGTAPPRPCPRWVLAHRPKASDNAALSPRKRSSTLARRCASCS